jgi:arylsulfatase A
MQYITPAVFRKLLFALSVGTIWVLASTFANGQQRPPNLVFVLADDLGYGDLGSFGQQKIRTPHLDRLASEGMRLTRHYSGNAVCAPSRCVLMTGYHPGHAFIRNNREVRPEGQYPIPADVQTLAELLQDAGYVTGGFGKWGLGPPGSEGSPLSQGFDRFFGYNCQRVAHNYYPTYLWDDEQRRPLDNPDFAAHQRFPADADPQDPASYVQYKGKDYAPDVITEAALQFIRDHRDEPFIVYVPSVIPHLALQAPDEAIEEYIGAFAEKEPYLGDKAYLPHRTPRAAYAAMISRLDAHVGQILELLEELHLAEKTIVVFSSDNGPLYDELGGTDTEFFNSAAGLRGRKGSLYEGGVRVPTIIRWPERIQAGSTSDYVSGFEDWMPTLLALIDQQQRTPPGIDGISLAPTLLGQEQPPRDFLYREFPAYGGQQAVWMGRWKGVRQNLMPRGKSAQPDLSIELYDLDSDPTESQNVAESHPEVVAQLRELMSSQHTPSKDFPIPALDNK